MNIPSATKTESRAINALKSIIDKSLYIHYQFNEDDKEMSWDGYIWLFKRTSIVFSKETAIARVPVQIKGHYDKERKYINKETISYGIELNDLKLYATEKGVLYFQIFMNKDKTSLFYTSLYPSKIASYIEEANRKGTKKQKNIPFIRLDQDAERLYNIVLQFNTEAMKQGSAFTPLVENRIRFDDWPKIKELNMSVIGAENPYDAFKRLSSGDVCLYGKTEGDSYFRPIQWVDDAKYYFGNIVKKPVKVQNTTYYQSYYVETDSDGAITVQFSHNLLLETANHKFKFDLKSPMPELYNDACFLLALLSANEYYVGDACIKYSRFELDSSFEERLHQIIDIYDTLKMIDLEIDNPFAQRDKENIDQLINLVNVRFGRPKAKEEAQFTRYNWVYNNKYYPIMIKDDGKSIELFSSLYSDKLGVFVEYQETEDRKRLCKLPLFLFVDSDVLANLYCFKYDLFLNQIRESEINEATYAPLLDRSILLINVFDINGDNRFLDLANEVFDRLNEFEPHDFLVINKLQIRQRISGLCEADINQLKRIESENPYTMFGKNVLLGNKQSADFYFSQIPSHDQEKYREYPIFALYSKLH